MKSSILRMVLLLLISYISFEMEGNDGVFAGDTLCSAKSAGELSISYNPYYIYISVKDIDETGENYFYKTGISEKKKSYDSSITLMRCVKDVSVVEIEGMRVEISYRGQDSDISNLTYVIPDPANRFVKSSLGSRMDDFSLSLGYKGKSKWSLVSTGLGMGWVTPLDSSPDLSTSMGHSMEWSWLSILGVRWSLGAHSLSMGLGIYWRNYSLDSGKYLEKEDGKISAEPFSPEIEKGKSRLQTFSLQLPLLYRFRFGNHRKFGAWVGPIVNFNTGCNIKTQYRVGDKDYKIITHGIGQKPVTVDALAAVSWHALSLYARYSPMKVLRKSSSLEFQSFSTGIMLMF
ncbi:MAG: hypothetical protein K2H46_08860 [Muribaculaceae bacterium]|nr:hypothetical protein [Muribaculaceae bacterium]